MAPPKIRDHGLIFESGKYIPNYEALSGIRVMAAIRKLDVDVLPQKVALTYLIHTVDKIRSSHKMDHVDRLWTMPRRVE